MNIIQDGLLVRVVYTSEASGKFSRSELMTMVHAARNWNEKRGITSALFYRDGCIAQVLEGDHNTMRLVCNRIRRDGRHHRIIQLASEPILKRFIPNHALKFYADDGLSRNHLRLSEVLVGGGVNKQNLLRLIVLAAIDL